MAVMHKMRENMHIILFFLLIMFVASMAIGGLVGGANILDFLGGRRSDTVLEVNGQQISYDQFNRARQAQLEDYRQKNEQEPTGYQLQQLEDQIWESIITDILKQQAIQDLNLKVTDEEIKYYIFSNPHPIFRMDQNFWNEDKQFDVLKFQAALSNPEAEYFWQYKEQQLRMYLPYEKLENEIKATVRVTDDELRDEYIKKNVKIKTKYMLFEPTKYTVSDGEITEQEIKKHYDEHKDEYKVEEKRKIRYVLFSTNPSAKDSSKTLSLVQTLLDSLNRGVDFASLAETYSDDPGSAANGGDLGYFARGAMVKPFEEAAFGAAIGAIVGPVESVHGLHIIKVEDKRTTDGNDEVKARHILLKFDASRETQEDAHENADYFSENAKERGFITVAMAESLQVDSTDYFRDSGFLPGLGMQKTIVGRAFHENIGNPSRVYFIENKGYFVFEIAGIQEKHIQPLDEVRTQIISKIKREKQLIQAGNEARTIREKIHSPEDFEKVAAEDSVKTKETDLFTIDGYVSGGVGRDPKFNGAAFGLDVNEVSAPIEGARGYYLIQLLEKQDVHENDFQQAKESLRVEVLQKKLRFVYTDWLENLKQHADIKDYRYMFY